MEPVYPQVLKPSPQRLEALYLEMNRVSYVHPDPLEYVLRYDHDADREIAGLISAGLAYGGVIQIGKSVETVLKPMAASPSRFIDETSSRERGRIYRSFKHRWTTSEELVNLLDGVAQARKTAGGLGALFTAGCREEDETVLPTLAAFVDTMNRYAGRARSSLMASPEDGSACKRMLLYLRWMIRRDEVDPGCWPGLSPSKLVVPVDTHMHRIGLMWGFTYRKQANLLAALDITRAFRRWVPEDPVRYDFALTRFGIRPELEIENLATVLA